MTSEEEDVDGRGGNKDVHHDITSVSDSARVTIDAISATKSRVDAINLKAQE